MARTKNNKKNNEINLSNIINETNDNIVNAKAVFLQNEEIKSDIDSKLKELEKQKIELSKKTKEDYLKIKQYKEEAMEKVLIKKKELEKKIETFKDAETIFKEKKAEFDKYKDAELDKLKQQKEEDEKDIKKQREELSKLKDELEEERLKLDADRIQYDMDKNELANNLMKFNELVSGFTVTIDQIKDKK